MADGSEAPSEAGPEAAGKDQRRADKARAKDLKRAGKAATRAENEAALARLNDETLGRARGFRVFNDGTVQKEKESALATLSSSSWIPGRVVLPSVELPRSAVVNVELDDRRRRRLPGSQLLRTVGSAAALAATNSNVGHWSTSAATGKASLTVATDRWVEVIVAESDDDVEGLRTLNKLLVHALSLKRSDGTAGPDHQQPVPPATPPPSSSSTPPPPPPGRVTPPPAPSTSSTPPSPRPSATMPSSFAPETSLTPSPPGSDVPGALRELKDLHDQGLLTDDEYESRRQALVARLPIGPPAHPPAGWHPDPYGLARLRWWDGEAWSSHTSP